MLDKLIKSCAVLLVFSILTTSVALAASRNIEWQEYDVSQQELIEAQFLESMYERIFSAHPEKNDGQMGIMASIGEYRLLTYTEAHLPPNIFWDQSLIALISQMVGYPLAIAGLLVKEAWAIVVGIAALLGQTIGDIEESKNATAKVGHSYRYLVKEGQVYTTAGWKTFYVSTSREWHGHEYALYIDKNNLTKHDSLNLGYLGQTDYAPNYSNNNHIMSQALTRWYYNLSPGREDWNGVYPDPDPQRSVEENLLNKMSGNNE